MTIAIKLGLTFLAISFWIISQKMIGRRQQKFKNGVGDYIHIFTNRWNLYLYNSPKLSNALLISSSLVIDILGLFIIATTLIGETLRPLLSLIILFALRQVNQVITVLPTPERMIWRDPGVPSIFVTYGVSNDLFFSGHTALAVLGALEIGALNQPSLQILATSIVVFEVAVVLLLRAHWTMDVFAGIVAALWAHDFSVRFLPTLNQWIGSF